MPRSTEAVLEASGGPTPCKVELLWFVLKFITLSACVCIQTF